MVPTRRIGGAVVFLLALEPGCVSDARHGDCSDCGSTGCRPEPTAIKEKKHCWEVEPKAVCVPAARWPWEHCENPTGSVKRVKVLKRVEYECDKSGYKWELPEAEAQCREEPAAAGRESKKSTPSATDSLPGR